MKRFEKSACVLLLTLGIAILAIATEKLQNEYTPPQDREELKATILLLGIPFTVKGGLLAWGLYRSGKSDREAREQDRRDRLASIFYQLLQTSNGRVTAIRLALEAGVSGKEAQEFLDEKAVEFNAEFEVSARGDIFYSFNL